MSAVVKPMRFAHSEGHTDVCYDETGEHLLTCGSDGDIRIYKGFDDSDPVSIQAGEHVTMVAVKDDRIFATPDNFAVQAFTFPEGSPDGILTRFPSTINHMCVNQAGSLLAAGSSDFSIKVVTLQDNSQKSFKGHTAPVLAVALDPQDMYLASSSCDGTVKIWKMENQAVVKTMNILPKVNDTSAFKTCRLGWQPGNGKYIAVPVEKEIQIYERDSWNLSFTLNKEGHCEIVSMVSWSPCGSYLASTSLDGQIIIWSIATQAVLERVQHESKLPITGIAWNPSGTKEIAYTDNQGQFGIIENISTKSTVTKPSGSEDQNIRKAMQLCDVGDWKIIGPSLYSHSANSIQLQIYSHDQQSTMKASGEKGYMDDVVMAAAVADYESDNDSLVTTKRRRVKQNLIDDEAEDDDDDEDDEFKEIRKLKAQLAAPLDFDDASNDVNADIASEVAVKKPSVVHVPVLPSLQQPFQPASTPTHLMHRFMVWNSVGIVRCHTEEDDLSTIEVEFHDASTHHPLHVTNHLNHTMAALSSSAVLLACKSQDDMKSKLVCLHFGSWDSSKEWVVDLPSKEEIEVVAVGENWAAVATNKFHIRIFTLTGIQLSLISAPGPVVSMSGHNNQLIVVYHAGNPLPNEQALGFKLFDLSTQQQTVADQRIPVSKKATLSWIGFSDEGTPVVVDSTGIVRFLNRSFGCTWTPVLDTKSQLKNKSDNYWVVGLEERTRQIRCILCKASSFPPTLPRPVQAVLPLQLPLCEMSTDKGEKEENWMKSKLMSYSYKHCAENGLEFDEEDAQHAETYQIQTLMKMFALACKSDREFRAFDICELLPNQRSVSLAIKYAAGIRKMNLAERLNELARRKAEEEEDALENDYNTPYEMPQPDLRIRSAPRSLPKRSARPRVSEQREEEEEIGDVNDQDEYAEDEEDDDDDSMTVDDKRKSKHSSDDGRPNPLLKKLSKPSKPTCSPSLSSSQGRSNPFKVLSPSEKAKGGKSFLESVEQEQKAATEAAKNKQPSITKKSNKKKATKTAKQMTLLSPTTKQDEPAKKDNKTDEKPAKKKSGFTLWLEENRSVIAEENKDASDGELIKLSMKQWKSLSNEEKKTWNDRAAGDGQDSDDKKRKRENNENDENENENVNATVTTKTAKKMKAAGADNSVSSKLAGFAYSKS